MTVVTASGEDVPSDVAQDLIRRAPSGYLWNQAYSLWLYLSLFLFQLVITRLLSVDQKGVYELILTPANFAVYLAALGLESAASVYLPRTLVERGMSEAAGVATRLLLVRLCGVIIVSAAMIWGLPALAQLLASTAVPGRVPGVIDQARALNSPLLQANRLPIAIYILSTGLANLLGALLTALLRTRLVFALGGLAQLATVIIAYVFVGTLHGRAGGALLALALPAGILALAYFVALAHQLGRPAVSLDKGALRGMLGFGLTVWLADLANGSLVKLLAVYQLGLAVSHAGIAYFGIAFEMGHSASFLLVAGLGGVGLAIMATAYAGRHVSSLAVAWRSISKVQVVLAVPLVAFCIPHADAILTTLYGNAYADAGGLLALFLVFNGIVRIAGGGASEAALYVLGGQRWVVAARWVSLLVLGMIDVLLIPRLGVAGALIGVGIAQVGVELFELVLARRWLARAYPFDFVVKALGAVVPALVLTTLWRPTSLAGLLASGVVFALLYVAALRLIAPLDSEDEQMLSQVGRPLRRFLGLFAWRARHAAADASVPLEVPTPRS